jgi:serralysin
MPLLTGTNGQDTLTGTSGDDSLNALSGADSISALGGNDYISIDDSGATDTIDGGPGWDGLGLQVDGTTLLLGSDSHIVGIEHYNVQTKSGSALDTAGKNGTQTVIISDALYASGSTNNAYFSAYGEGTFTIDATAVKSGHSANLFGGSGNDTLLGGAGNEFLGGNDGNDSLIGGAGMDGAQYYFGQNSLSGLALSGNAATGWTLSLGDAPLLKLQADTATGVWTVTDLRTAQWVSSSAFGTDTLQGIETLVLDAQDSNGAGYRAANLYIGGTVAEPTLALRDVAGTSGGDTLTGTSGNDQINGLGGADLIDAQAGNDNVSIDDSGATDTIDGGVGWDVLNLRVEGAPLLLGADAHIVGIEHYNVQPKSGSALDTAGANGVQTIVISDSLYTLGSTTNAYFSANGACAYTLDATAVKSGHTTNLYAGSGNDTLLGGAGNDYLGGNAGNDSLVGGAGEDQGYYTFGQGLLGSLVLVVSGSGAQPVWTLNSLSASVTTPLLKLQADTVTGVWTVTDLRTSVGLNSTVFGTDTLQGIESLALDAQDSNSSNYRAANVYIGGTVAEPTLVLRDVAGTSGNDTLTGTSGNDQINALGGADLIDALAGNDNIGVTDNASTDTIDGGEGWDNLTLRIDGGALTLGENPNIRGIENYNLDPASYAGTQTVKIVDSLFSAANTNNAVVNIWGSNVLLKLDASAVLTGHTINLNGSSNSDTLIGGAGNDRFQGNGGDDVIVGGAGFDTLFLIWQNGDPLDLSNYRIVVSTDGKSATLTSSTDTNQHTTLSGVERLEFWDGSSTHGFQLADFMDPQVLGEQGLTASDAQRWNATAALGTPVTVSFSFVESAPSSGPGAEGFQTFDSAARLAVRSILSDTALLTGLSFIEVKESATSVGQIRFGASAQSATKGLAYPPDPSAANATAGDVWMDIDSILALSPGSEGFAALRHEIGHALGLRHPRNVDAGDAWAQVLREVDDRSNLTVMSGQASPDGLFRADWGLLDVAALRYLYGSRTDNTSDNTYDLAAFGALALQTLVDDGGADRLDASASAVGVFIDLVPGHASSVGVTLQGEAAQENVGIAVGTWIEQAVGTNADDVLLGNAHANTLSGLAGNDWIDGAGGADTAVFSGKRASYFVTTGFGKVFVAARDGAQGFDTLLNMEALVFADEQVQLSASAMGQDVNITALQGIAANGLLPEPSDQLRGGVHYAIDQQAAKATVSISDDGAYVYQSAADFDGNDSFTYSMRDASGNSNTYWVKVNVLHVTDVVEMLAYSWKAHTLLDSVRISTEEHDATTENGTAKFNSVAGSSLTLSVERDVPQEELTATSNAVNLQDAIAILKMIVGLPVNGSSQGVPNAISPYQALAADFNADGEVSLQDALDVLKKVVGLTAPEPIWHFLNEIDASVAAKANLQPGLAQATVTAPLTGAGPVHVGLVAYLSGDVDGSYTGAAGSVDLDVLQPSYFATLVANHPGVLSTAQFGG